MKTRKPPNKQPNPIFHNPVTEPDIEDPREAVVSRSLREVADPIDDSVAKRMQAMRDSKELKLLRNTIFYGPI